MVKRKFLILEIVILSLFILTSCSVICKPIANNLSMDKGSILSKVFTEGNHKVSIMQIVLPDDVAKRINEITTRYKNSILKNQQWYKEYISKNANTEGNLLWNEKFGISEEEYNEMISSEEKMKVTEKKKTTISIVKSKKGELTINENADLPYLSGLKIDTANNTMTVENGTFKYDAEINNTDEKSLTGRWSGGAWKLDFEELKDLNNIDKKKTYGAINISVGQLEKTKQMIVYYKERVIHKGFSYKGEEIIYINN